MIVEQEFAWTKFAWILEKLLGFIWILNKRACQMIILFFLPLCLFLFIYSMEKYSRWRDAGTGIQPFLPPVPPRTDSSILVTLSNVIHIVVGPIQAIVKITLISIVSAVYFLFVPVFGALLTPIAPLKRLWTRVFSAILLRLVLFIAGFFHIKTETLSIRKSRGSGRVESSSVKNGDVIVANWTSYIDVVYLASRFVPVFTQIYTESEKIKIISLWEAIRLAGKIPESAPSSDDQVYTVQELSLKAKKGGWGPIVVFAEGTTTNGRALLKFAPIFKDYKVDQKDGQFQVMAFKYEYAGMSPTYTVGNQLFHFFKLCSQFHNTLIVKSLANGEAPCSPHSQVPATGSISDDPVGDLLIAAVGNISKLRKTNLSMTDKRDFLSYYESRKSK
ncbi:uncharacterized protein EV154DRAFT_496683 [Mucor mucedo]|uniref:uncharacterized protein n=1 Tax=Mucor mucedo TaxID=29922 RepID=UPI00221FA81C|nr:uncharacterized protein EV154DRAFT_496683 [Mucor mucedo]KAI7895003.1 hypothetical protein EV154DRAFT_496683 [Mucor mucedo]